jgi:hypothetical protein
MLVECIQGRTMPLTNGTLPSGHSLRLFVAANHGRGAVLILPLRLTFVWIFFSPNDRSKTSYTVLLTPCACSSNFYSTSMVSRSLFNRALRLDTGFMSCGLPQGLTFHKDLLACIYYIINLYVCYKFECTIFMKMRNLKKKKKKKVCDCPPFVNSRVAEGTAQGAVAFDRLTYR